MQCFGWLIRIQHYGIRIQRFIKFFLLEAKMNQPMRRGDFCAALLQLMIDSC